MTRGLTYFHEGNFEQAVIQFSEAARVNEAAGQPHDQIKSLTFLAESFYYLGQYPKALITLKVALQHCEQLATCGEQPTILGRLGNGHFALGHADQAITHLESALALARNNNRPAVTAALLNDLGNVLTAEHRNAEALAAYTECLLFANAASDEPLAITALINSAKAWAQENEPQEASARLSLAMTRAHQLEPSHQKAVALVNIGIAYRDLHRAEPSPIDGTRLTQAAQALQLAAETADHIQDPVMTSYAFGHLGQLYESQGRQEEALQLTRRAILALQTHHAPEALYQWEWQTGRILQALKLPQEAILAYRRAVATLQPLRTELSQQPGSGATSFRETVGPLFFQLADLQLTQAGTPKPGEDSHQWLVDARDTIEAFKVAELQDYFRDDCVKAAQSHVEGLEQISQKTTAILYPIILPDRLELLVSIGNDLRRQTVNVPEQTFTQTVRLFRTFLEKRTTNQYKPHAQQLYDWLIRPLEPWFKDTRIDTLVVVPDGALRTIPLSALHDGQQFLTEQYALATSPGMTLTDPQPINRESLRVLSLGITESVQGFAPLPNVATELEALHALYQGQQLLNEQFLESSLEQKMKEEPFTIVHIASHGQFANDPKDAFVLTFDKHLTMDQLDKLIGLYQFRDSPLDLLTLSACETAAGDDRAALGLAGVAIKAGARSALATLWFINDKVSSDLIAEFYSRLRDPSTSKARALQEAQLLILANPAFQHPGYWAPFLLLNNWL